MLADGFQHASQVPKATLMARLTEMVQAGRIERLSRSIYQARWIEESGAA